MKHLLIIGMLALCGTVIAQSAPPLTAFPDGRFMGFGEWHDQAGNLGDYSIYYTFTDNNLRADVTSPEGDSETWEIAFIFTDNGAFSISQNGNTIGSGLCDSLSCKMNFTIGSTIYKNTIYVLPQIYFNLGYKIVNGQHIYWQSYLLPLTP